MTLGLDPSRRGLLKMAGATGVAAAAFGRASAAAARGPAKLFSTDVGEGRNVLLLHGWTCDSNDWIGQLPALESRYRVVAADLRGHGRSEIPPPGSYSPADYVADVEALIASKQAGPFVVVGHSMGTQIAARLAAKRPDLVSAVVSVDGALGFSEEVGQAFGQAAQQFNAGDPAVLVPAFFQNAYDPATDPAFRRWHARRVQGMPTHVVRESFPPLFSGPDQAGIGEGSARLCRRITQPVYHLCRDPAQGERMRPWFSHPKSKVDVWSNAGHWIMQDRRDEVNTAIIAWIDAL